MTTKEGVETAKVAGAGESMAGKASIEKKTPEKPSIGGNIEDHKNKPVTVAKSPQKVVSTSPKTGVQKSSNGVDKAAKISNGPVKVEKSFVSKSEASKQVPHYLRASTSSCHDACKYGMKSNSEASDAPKHSHSHQATSSKSVHAVSRSAVAKIPKAPKSIASTKSPIVSSSKVSPREKVSVNKVESEVKSVKSSPLNSRNLPHKPTSEKKTKVANASPTTMSRSPKPAVNGNSNAKTVTPVPNKKVGIRVKATTPRRVEKKNDGKTEGKSHSRLTSSTVSSNAPEEGPNGTGKFEVGGSHRTESDSNCQIYANEGTDAQFHESSQRAGESSDEEHDHIVMQNIHSEEEEDHCNDGYMAPACIAHESMEFDEYGDEKNENFERYRENLVTQYGDNMDLDSIYSEEYSEYSESPRSGSHNEEGESVNVRKEHQMISAEEGNSVLEKRRFRRGRGIHHSSDPNPQPENVVLRHQDVQGRKGSEEWMLNHVIEEAVNKLSHTRKSKVKALVGAFETVISLTESETAELKNAGTKDLPQMSPLQACT